MMGKKEIRALEDVLGSTSVALPKNDADPYKFEKEWLPYLLGRYEDAKKDVAKLGMTTLVETAIRDCLPMTQQGRRDEAKRLLLDACIALSERSGTMDDMRRLYTASNDPK